MPKTVSYDKRVDEKISQAAPFAQPILQHLREHLHKAVPEIAEDIKWGHISFLLDGKIFCGMGSFKEHCSFGFWRNEINKEISALGYKDHDAMGLFGKLTSVKQLPNSKELTALIKKAAAFARMPAAPKKRATPKPELPVPAVLATALKKSKAATKHFAELSPSCRREYIEWIQEAKRDETRDKRVAQAIEWIAEGKQRNWKYQAR